MESVTLCYASAGAGKTHALVNTYLTCLLANPQQVSGVVAITFTKRATAEMKHRIAERLKALACGEDQSLTEELAETLHIAADGIQKQATYLWNRFQTHYEEFAIMTIDSFFQRLVATFSQGLSLPPDYTLSLNNKEILKSGLKTLWRRVDQEHHLAQALLALTRHRLEQGKSWDCRKDVQALGEVALTTATNPSSCKEPSSVKDFLTWCKGEKAEFEKKIQEGAKSLLQKIDGSGFIATDFAWGKKASTAT